MTCGMALLSEWYRRSLGPGPSIERSRDKGLESDVDIRDATLTRAASRGAGGAQPGSAGHIEDSAMPGTMTLVLFPPEGRFDEYRRCRSHRIFH
jgi:hypothetical protein